MQVAYRSSVQNVVSFTLPERIDPRPVTANCLAAPPPMVTLGPAKNPDQPAENVSQQNNHGKKSYLMASPPRLAKGIASAHVRCFEEGHRFRLMIVSPFLHERVVTDEFMQDLERLLRRACKVYIGYGMPDSDSQKPSKSHLQVLERLEKLARRFSTLVLSKIDSHAKILIQDELFAVLGSFNWLSFRGDPDRAFRDEQSALVALPSMVERKFQSELKLFS